MNKNTIISHYLLSIGQMGAYINDLTDSEIKKVFEPMNCIGWLLGHCSYYNFSIANKISNTAIPEEAKKYMNGMPHSTPGSVRQLLGKKPGNPGYGKWNWRY